MELLLFTIPFLLISTIHTQDEPGIKLTKGPTEVAKRGDSFKVDCYLTEATPGYNDDNVVYTWYNNKNESVTSTSSNTRSFVRDRKNGGKSLIISPIIDDDAGIYRCWATVNEVTYKHNFTLEIEATIEFSECPPDQKGVMGQEAKLSCVASPSQVETYWEKNGTSIELDSKNGTSRYRLWDLGIAISNLNDVDAGEYKYWASSDKELKFQTVTLTVIVAPRITRPIGGTTGYVDEKHELFCRASGRPLPEIQWYREGTANMLTTGGRIKVSSKVENGEIQGILEFDPLIKEDEDVEFTCKAVGIKITDGGPSLEDSTSDTIKVNIRPKVEPLTDQTGREGGSIALVCDARGEPPPEVQWMKVSTNQVFTKGSNDGDITVSETANQDENNPGKVVRLQFSNLKGSDAGDYKCIAVNVGGEAEDSLYLRVYYKPNFEHSAPGPFYTWIGNSDSFVTCTAHGDPAPTFRWYKVNDAGSVEVTSSSPDYTVTSTKDPDNEFNVTSKLEVTYSGSNSAVFGQYRCEATNEVETTNHTVFLNEGKVPGMPIVSSHKIFATRIEFYLYDGTVLGPPVKQYKITYTNPSGQSQIAYFTKETRQFTDDKSSSLKTRAEIKDLTPRTEYTFRIVSINDVGDGAERVTTLTTADIKEPGVVVINAQTEVNPDRITVTWLEPDNGGSVILSYNLTYQEVEVNVTAQGTYTILRPIGNIIQENVAITGLTHTIRNGIKQDSFYRVTVAAENGVGKGLPGQRVFRTLKGGNIGPVGGAPRPVSMSTTVTIFGCLAALSACLKSFV